MRKRRTASRPLVCAREGTRMHVSAEFRPFRDDQLGPFELKKSPSRDPPRRRGPEQGIRLRPRSDSVAAPFGEIWGRRRAAHAGLRARASHRSRQHQARRLRCHGNRGLPVPAFGRRRSRPGGAGLALLGDLQRASASAARSPGFHPSPTSAWRRLTWGLGLMATWWPSVSGILLSFESRPFWPM